MEYLSENFIMSTNASLCMISAFRDPMWNFIAFFYYMSLINDDRDSADSDLLWAY